MEEQHFRAEQVEVDMVLIWMLMLRYVQPNMQLRPKCFDKRKKGLVAACSDFTAH